MTPSIPASPTSAGAHAPKRLYYVDSLRVLAILLVFFYHSWRAFNLSDWHVKNVEQSFPVTAMLAFFEPWGMPFFFLLAGAGAMFALRRRSARQYLSERVLRLLVPFAAGSLLFTPLQLYLEWSNRTQRGMALGSFRDYLTRHLRDMPLTNPSLFGWLGIHLWFLGFLLLAALVTLPLLLWLKRTPAAIDLLARACAWRGSLLLFAVPLTLVQWLLEPFFPGDQNWAMFFGMASFFTIGYIFMTDPRFVAALRRDRWIMLAGALIGFASLVTMYMSGSFEAWMADPGKPQFYLFFAAFCLDGWCWTATMLYVGVRFMDKPSRWVDYGQEAVLPFYVIHQPVILTVAFVVVQWSAGIALKWLFIFVPAFAISVAIYELLIKRVAVLRMCFGLKPAAPAAPQTAAIAGNR